MISRSTKNKRIFSRKTWVSLALLAACAVWLAGPASGGEGSAQAGATDGFQFFSPFRDASYTGLERAVFTRGSPGRVRGGVLPACSPGGLPLPGRGQLGGRACLRR